MKIDEFVNICRQQTFEYDVSINRTHNRDAIGRWVRELSYRLSYVLVKLDLRGQDVLMLHFGLDLAALSFVMLSEPLMALACWFFAHLLDNCDGVVARYRNEQDLKWGELDITLHLIANMAFWLIIGLQVGAQYMIAVLLAARVVQEYFRNKKTNKDRYGERSRMWKLIVWPTNVNAIYAMYVGVALLNWLDYYVLAYASYLTCAACYQVFQHFVEIYFEHPNTNLSRSET